MRIRALFGPGPVWGAWLGGSLLGLLVASPDGAWRGLSIVSFFIGSSLLLSVAIHEAGHAAGARLVDYRLFKVAVGPVELSVRPDRRWKLGVNSSWSYLGRVVALPEEPDRLRRRQLVFAAAGPAANFLAVGLIQLIIVAVPALGSPRASAGWAVFFFGTILRGTQVLGMICGVTNLLPFKVGRVGASDGRQVITMIKGGVAAERMAIVATLGSHIIVKGVAPGEIDPRMVARALELLEGSPQELLPRMMAYEAARGHGHLDEAESNLRRAYELSDEIPGLRPAIAAEVASFLAFYRGETGAARDVLPATASGELSEGSLLRAAAAVCLAEGDLEQAHGLAHDARNLLAGKSDLLEVERRMEEEWLELILSRIEELQSSGPNRHH